MKIRGYFGQFEAPYINTLIIVRRKIVDEVRFLVDTGAYDTVMSEKDAKRLKIDYSTLPKREEGLLGIGGITESYLLKAANILFPIEDGNFLEWEIDLPVMRHQVKNEEIEERIKWIPSLLGRDFLNKFTLIVSKQKDVVLITDEKV